MTFIYELDLDILKVNPHTENEVFLSRGFQTLEHEQYRQTERQTDKQTGRQTDRQTDKQTDRQTDKQTDRQTD